MFKQKSILFWSSIIAVIVAVFSLYYFSRDRLGIKPLPEKLTPTSYQSTTTSSTSPEALDFSAGAIANWSVCRNEKYGYEFKYPKGWYVYGSYSRNPPQVVGATLCERGMIIRISPTEPNTRYDPTKQEFSIMAEDQTDLQGQPCEDVHSIDECRKRALRVTPSILPVEKETMVDGEITQWTGDIKNGTGIAAEFFHKGTVFGSHSQKLGYQFHNAILSTFKFIQQ